MDRTIPAFSRLRGSQPSFFSKNSQGKARTCRDRTESRCGFPSGLDGRPYRNVSLHGGRSTCLRRWNWRSDWLSCQARLDEVARRVADATGRSGSAIASDLSNKADLRRIETICARTPGSRCWSTIAGVGALEPRCGRTATRWMAMIGCPTTRRSPSTASAAFVRDHQHRLECRRRPEMAYADEPPSTMIRQSPTRSRPGGGHPVRK